jgi:hypothetical protein
VPASEAARRLGISRARVYTLVEQGALDNIGGDSIRVSLASLERRLGMPPPVGQPLSPSSAWAVLALASGDAAFRDHVAARLSDPDRPRARTRLQQHSLLELLPRLCGRANPRRFAAGAEALLDILRDPRLVVAGPSAARALGWKLPDGSWPVEAYVNRVGAGRPRRALRPGARLLRRPGAAQRAGTVAVSSSHARRAGAGRRD